MMTFLRKIKNFLTGNWWVVVEENNRFGVYHPTKHHVWDYPYVCYFTAKEEVDKLNNGITVERHIPSYLK
jgi:hypothetical protein